MALTRRRLLASALRPAALAAAAPGGLLPRDDGEEASLGPRAGARERARADPPPYPPLPQGLRPFAPGEHLRYDVAWSGIGAGRAVLEVVGAASRGEQSGLLVRFTAETNTFVSLFYRLRDRHESLLDPLFLFTRRYEARTEQGRRRRHRLVVFEPKAGRFTRADLSSGRVAVLPLDGPAVDGLGLVYHLRVRALEPGGRLVVPLYRKHQVRPVTVAAGRPTVTETPAGRFETMEVRAADGTAGSSAEETGTDRGGFFGDASFSIWFTADRRRLPVRLAGRTRHGSIDARLAALRLPRPRAGG